MFPTHGMGNREPEPGSNHEAGGGFRAQNICYYLSLDPGQTRSRSAKKRILSFATTWCRLEAFAVLPIENELRPNTLIEFGLVESEREREKEMYQRRGRVASVSPTQHLLMVALMQLSGTAIWFATEQILVFIM